ncbi:dephospho-CoA kinase [Flexivirga oryzae]|uniref:Dephospho-CoA kinase n=1 Tax=Flexivirga oryzae TaxID=1794944 RepID=A0A839N0Y4_9MICO|nr:dephospho-CoA kinase [Flexivirga oryzae]
MLYVGLSGGIGSGKSTVSARLIELGAVVIDADLIARDVVAPDTPGLAAVVERFGPGLLSSDGALDRPALGAVVFADRSARRDLEAIIHPLVRDETARRRAAAPREAIVVHDVPLLVEGDLAADHHLTVIVDTAEHIRAARLGRDRGMTEQEAAARIGAQATDEQRYAVADVLLENNGTHDELLERVETLWRERLSPYNDNLLAGRGAQPGTRAVDGPAAARAVARVRRQLDFAGLGDHIGQLGTTGSDTIEVRLAPAPAVGDSLRRALLAAGFVGAPGATDFTACDPAAPLRLSLRDTAG